MSVVINNIGLLVTNDPSVGGDGLGQIRDAAVVIDGDRIVWVGRCAEAPAADYQADMTGACIIPGFVDSHSHPVFAGDRSDEFDARMNGQKYEAGGILRTVRRTREASVGLLDAVMTGILDEMALGGTTTVEAKTGYGLDIETEVKLAQVASSHTDEVTFLGAHVVGPEYEPDEYVRLVCGEMLQAVRPYVRWIDAFCETGAFDPDQTMEILHAGKDAGLGLRLHAAQLGPSEVIPQACELGLASVDHCTFLSDEDIDAMKATDTVATLLPAAEFSTKQPYPDARRLLDAGVTVALATDCNPGTAFTSSMPFCLAIAVREMGMTPEQALWAATAGGAAALHRDDVGVIKPGARADLVGLAAPSWLHLMYRPGVPLIDKVCRGGRLLTLTQPRLRLDG
ncbi:MAG: imidazolonepropionase [Cutibacterium avidum]|nr:imidazolonepropionase [Cutibacterium avidum]